VVEVKAKTLTSIGPPVFVSRIRQRGCSTAECPEKTRLALVMPLADIDDGNPGLGAVALCADCMEEAVVKLSGALRS
jgi:hypothetical protein